MSATAPLVKRLLSDRSPVKTGGDTRSVSASRAEIKAAAKEGAAEALGEYQQATPEERPEAVVAELEETKSASKGGSRVSLKRLLALGLLALFVLRRRQKRDRSADIR